MSSTTSDSAELEALEKELQSVQSEHEALRELRRLLFDESPEGVMLLDASDRLELNASARSLLGASPSDRSWRDDWAFVDEQGSAIEARGLPCFAALSGDVPPETVFRRGTPDAPGGAILAMESRPFADGRSISVVRDITARRRLRDELQRRAQELSQRQADNASLVQRLQAAIDNVENPVLSVADNVLVMPIIGVFDASRSTRVTEQVLQAVETRRARWLILDITDIDGIDATTAGLLARVVGAVQLLGAKVLISGMSPEVARTLIEIAEDIERFPTYRTLREALEAALGRKAGQGPSSNSRATRSSR